MLLRNKHPQILNSYFQVVIHEILSKLFLIAKDKALGRLRN